MVVINTKIIEHISREKIKFKNRNFKLNKYEKCVLYAKKYLYLFNGKIELDELVNEIYICFYSKNKYSYNSLLRLFEKLYLKYFDISELQTILNKSIENKMKDKLEPLEYFCYFEKYGINDDSLNKYYKEYAKDCTCTTEDSIECITNEIFNQELADNVHKIMNRLLPREQYIVKSIYDNDETDKAISKTAEDLDVSSERIRQINAKALRKLKYACIYDKEYKKVMKSFKEYL